MKMRQFTRAVLTTVGLALALGVLTTYGVAWWIANTHRPTRHLSFGDYEGRAVGGWSIDMETQENVTWVVADGWELDSTGGMVRWQEEVPPWSLIRKWTPREVGGPVGVNMNNTLVRLLERAAGWPRLAVVEHAVTMRLGVPPPVKGADLSIRWGASSDWARWTLAFRPLWAGFAIDTAMFGAGWWVVIGIVAWVRSWRRRAAGLCAGCRYDLRGLTGEVCPECGLKV